MAKQEYLTLEEIIKGAGAELEKARKAATRNNARSAAKGTTRSAKPTRAKNAARTASVTKAKPSGAKPSARSVGRQVARSVTRAKTPSVMRKTVNGIDITSPKRARASAARNVQRAHKPRMRFRPQDIDRAIVNAANKYPAGYKKIKAVVDKANARLIQLERNASYSPALKQTRASTKNGRFTVNNKMSWEEMKRVYSQSLEFINSPTSTVGNAKVYLQSLSEKLDITPTHTKMLVNKLNEIYIKDNGYIGALDSETIRTQLLEMAEDMPIDEMNTERGRFSYYQRMLFDIETSVDESIADLKAQDFFADASKAFYGF